MSEFSKLTWLREARPQIRKLTATQRDVLDVIFDRTNEDGQNAHPSQEQIAETIGKSDRQVRDILGQLRELGLIVRTERGNKRLGHADKYSLWDYRNSKASGNGSPEVSQDHRNSRGSGNELDYRKSEAGLPEVSGVITGSAALPPNRSCTSDPGPTDQEMIGEDDQPGESEHSADFASCSQPGDSEPEVKSRDVVYGVVL
ncbi:helix-turn-helix domain-containing protein [Mycobacterium arosiense]|uniref:Helix-turn-helix domain-containing protein n=1 Tax=Mycobacterium arosiense ATCC BAA-1401 = DSM 45069 TaxID=1265311 RepID=A0A1W9ZM62_MYCAI|nr:helix-turn-helix domain-containing protein [Mycobacterium arosiense]ORA18088.1 hypothetical protein BST14_08140 [Mycobacterium arosiense ATCC BAA-1401 = DSM 45069]